MDQKCIFIKHINWYNKSFLRFTTSDLAPQHLPFPPHGSRTVSWYCYPAPASSAPFRPPQPPSCCRHSPATPPTYLLSSERKLLLQLSSLGPAPPHAPPSA